MEGRKKEEGSSATDSVTDVTDVTDVADVRKKEEGRIIPQTRKAQCFSVKLSNPNDQRSISQTNRGCLAPPLLIN